MYEFKQLSPADFEDLTRDLLQKHWGVTLESFKTGRDQGIDLRFSALPTHNIIIQCKHFAGSTISKLIHELKNTEAPKVVKLAPSRYVLVTSLPLNPTDKDKIRNVLNPFVLNTEDIVGASELNNLLGLHPDVETKHFKLWLSSVEVLKRVLYNAERIQTDFDVERVRRAIPRYVQNSNYSTAMKILNENRFVIISGVPGIGKTTLADMLLFAHLEASYEPIVIKSEIVEGRRLFNNEAKQVFYFDDFLGETFLGNRFDFVGKKEDSAILDFMDIVAHSKHSRMILTTREHILQHAFHISERFNRGKGSLSAHRCILDLKSYGLLDRARILYNHIYFSDLPDGYKAELLKNRFYLTVLRHRNFNPRLVEWLSKFTNIQMHPAASYKFEIERVLENPSQLWRIAFEQQISEAARSVLLALYSLGGSAPLYRLEEAWRDIHQNRALRHHWRTAAEDWRRSLQDLEGGFIVFDSRGGTRQRANFVNPSVKDFLDVTLLTDVEHLDDLLSSLSSFEQVVNLWSLAISEKGIWTQEHFLAFCNKLLIASEQLLPRPHTESSHEENRSHDVRPEIKLKTLVSICSRIRSTKSFELVFAYTQTLIDFWKNHSVDFAEGTAILRILDNAEWLPLRNSPIHWMLKRAILVDLADSAGSGDLGAVVRYADSQECRWDDQDKAKLRESFEFYLGNAYEDELDGCSDVSDLESLASDLDWIATACDHQISEYHEEIEKRVSRLTKPDYHDDDDRTVQRWKDEPSTQISDRMEEIEVSRIFDGLR